VFPSVWISWSIWNVGVVKSCGCVVVSCIFISSVVIAAILIEMCFGVFLLYGRLIDWMLVFVMSLFLLWLIVFIDFLSSEIIVT